MREFFQSCASLAFSMSLLTVEMLDNIAWMDRDELRGSATKAVDAVSGAAVDQLGPRLQSTFRALNDIQRGAVGIMFDVSLQFARNTLDRFTDQSESGSRRESYSLGDERRHREAEYQDNPRHASSSTQRDRDWSGYSHPEHDRGFGASDRDVRRVLGSVESPLG